MKHKLCIFVFALLSLISNSFLADARELPIKSLNAKHLNGMGCEFWAAGSGKTHNILMAHDYETVWINKGSGDVGFKLKAGMDGNTTGKKHIESFKDNEGTIYAISYEDDGSNNDSEVSLNQPYTLKISGVNGFYLELDLRGNCGA